MVKMHAGPSTYAGVVNPLDRIEDKFLIDDGCWPWIGVVGNHGYGVITIEKVQYLAHRLIYELLVALIPPELVIDHTCRNRICQNPGHMQLVSREENTRLGTTRAEPQVTCKRGHTLRGQGADVYVAKSGSLVCRPCRALNNRAYWRRKKGGGH